MGFAKVISRFITSGLFTILAQTNNMTTCKNCEREFVGNYCNNCGQKAKTERLDWHYISDEAKYTFLHFNGGLLYSTKQLFTRPGDSIREFIEGKRIHHYKPILLLFVLAGIYTLLLHYIDMDSYIAAITDNRIPKTAAEKYAFEMQNKVTVWIRDHYSIIELAQVPFYSLASWLAFRKYGYNFIEHVILNSFASAQRLIFNIVVIPIFIVLSRIDPMYIMVSSVVTFLGYGLTIWTFITFFRGRDLGMIILRYILFLALFTIMMIVTLVVGVVVTLLMNPHLLKMPA
ncbi:MAG: DUF3667 domain-containing protein [Proteobacteria bacterium]|nr:MAG: DUF3667 domain-containing protein [Pseudomonadota bacterium]